jgi:hypothetical protein
LCGSAARLDLHSAPGQGFHATLHLPQRELRNAVIAAESDHD